MTGANTTDYVLDGDNAIGTLLNGAVDKTWFHGARGPEHERTGSGNPLWYLYDGLGSVLGTVGGSGNLVNTRKYDVYGTVRASTGGSGPKHKFVGELGHPSEDETGLVYMRARYMDPALGRFASEDQARSGRDWFSYANHSPIYCVDRSGHATLIELLLNEDLEATKAAEARAAQTCGNYCENHIFRAVAEWEEKNEMNYLMNECDQYFFENDNLYMRFENEGTQLRVEFSGHDGMDPHINIETWPGNEGYSTPPNHFPI